MAQIEIYITGVNLCHFVRLVQVLQTDETDGQALVDLKLTSRPPASQTTWQNMDEEMK